MNSASPRLLCANVLEKHASHAYRQGKEYQVITTVESLPLFLSSSSLYSVLNVEKRRKRHR